MDIIDFHTHCFPQKIAARALEQMSLAANTLYFTDGTKFVIPTTPPPFTVGDVNGDGAVNIADVTALIDYLLGSGGSINVDAADVNGDEAVNIADVTALIDNPYSRLVSSPTSFRYNFSKFFCNDSDNG